MKNLNLIFNKLYYEQIGEIFKGKNGEKAFTQSLEKCNYDIFNTVFNNKLDYNKTDIAKQTLILKTTYPGLLIGTGNPHGTGKSDEDINMGFSFDYVTGQPYIPGSSVKGVLRSHFKNSPEVIKEILEQEDVAVNALEKEIFDDGNDVFLDAVLYDGDEYGRVMGEDYITPHKDATKNPIPIRIIKILPNVRFEFRFILTDGIITSTQKLELFTTLLQVFGAGAKTNVGYGVFVNDDLNGAIPEKKELPSQNYKPKTQNSEPKGDYRKNSSNNEKIKCPHCGEMNWKYFKDGGTRNKCFKCHEFLFPKK